MTKTRAKAATVKAGSWATFLRKHTRTDQSERAVCTVARWFEPLRALMGTRRPPMPAAGRVLRKAAVRPEAVLVSAKRLPRDWGIMPRQCAGRGGQWAGSSARTHG